MSDERFWNGVGKTALNIATVGGTGKFEALQREAEDAGNRYSASREEYEQLQARINSVGLLRDEARRGGASRLNHVQGVLRKFDNLTGVDIHSVSDQDCPEVAKMQRALVDFNVAAELIAGSGIGIATSAGAWAAVSALGVASTGTAIGSLSGVAASNAILAFFGGGSLATGGGGMALGSAVVGGLAVVPAVMVGSWLTHRAANKKRSEIEPQIESINAETLRIDRIVRMVNAECIRIESVTLRTNELEGKLWKHLQVLEASVHSLKVTGSALADAMNAPGFNFPDPLPTEGPAGSVAHSAC
jgi:hypothetical protein